jgi:hypothetical protein
LEIGYHSAKQSKVLLDVVSVFFDFFDSTNLIILNAVSEVTVSIFLKQNSTEADS